MALMRLMDQPETPAEAAAPAKEEGEKKKAPKKAAPKKKATAKKASKK